MHAYAEACRALVRARIPYVMVGAFGVGLYSEGAGLVITTGDCDLLLPANTRVLSRALALLRKLGYDFEAGGEPLLPDPEVLEGVVRARANVLAHREGVRIDLPLEIAGCDFASLWKRRRRFRMGGVPVNVAPLEDILRSKELAGRPKDRLFLETYRDALAQLLEADRRPSGRRT